MGRIDLNRAVRATTEMVRDSLASHGIHLDVDLHDAPLWVQGDLVRLQQLILNLVHNARDAMPSGGTLTLRTSLDGKASLPAPVVMEVEDTGIGIAPGDLERIFQPLFSRKPPGQGTGLGLAICQKVAKEMGGEILVSSRLGQGTIFTIHLPGQAGAPKSEVCAHG